MLYDDSDRKFCLLMKTQLTEITPLLICDWVFTDRRRRLMSVLQSCHVLHQSCDFLSLVHSDNCWQRSNSHCMRVGAEDSNMINILSTERPGPGASTDTLLWAEGSHPKRHHDVPVKNTTPQGCSIRSSDMFPQVYLPVLLEYLRTWYFNSSRRRERLVFIRKGGNNNVMTNWGDSFTDRKLTLQRR